MAGKAGKGAQKRVPHKVQDVIDSPQGQSYDIDPGLDGSNAGGQYSWADQLRRAVLVGQDPMGGDKGDVVNLDQACAGTGDGQG